MVTEVVPAGKGMDPAGLITTWLAKDGVLRVREYPTFRATGNAADSDTVTDWLEKVLLKLIEVLERETKVSMRPNLHPGTQATVEELQDLLRENR